MRLATRCLATSISWISVLFVVSCSGGGALGTSSGRSTNEANILARVHDGTDLDVDEQSSTDTINANWFGYPDTVNHFEWAIGTAQHGVDVQGWRSVGTANYASQSNLGLKHGDTYYVTVRAFLDGTTIHSEESTDGVTVNDPNRGGNPVVRDGTGNDLDTQTSTASFSANWSGFPTPVDEYRWAIGTSAGAADVLAWTSVGMASQATRNNLQLVRGNRYFASVRARTGSVLGPMTSSDGVLVVPISKLTTLSAQAVDLSRKAKLIWFDERLSGGAHTWVFEGGEFGKAAIAFVGDTRVDTELLRQIRYLLVPGKGLTCTGGFHDQKQLGSTTMFLLAKRTPRIWNQLTQNEKDKIDASVFGALVSSSFTTSDKNPFVRGAGPQRAMNGDFDMNRDWNPNYRNGMLGTVIVGGLYFGLSNAQAMLKAYDHKKFIDRLRALKLDNLVKTYTSSDPNAPTVAHVEGTLHQDYSYKGIPLADVMAIYVALTEFTYSRPVQCGLNNGAGKVGGGLRGGYMAKNCASLPNKGKPGMLREFDSGDSKGPRSSAHYSNDGWYVNNYIHYALVATKAWKDDAKSAAVLDLIEVGTEDLRFKIDPNKGGGYFNFQSGKGSRTPYLIDDVHGHRINFAVADVLRRYHQ